MKKLPPYRYNASRAMTMCGQFDYDMLNVTLPVMSKLDEKVDPDGIQVHLTSPGGAATIGLAVYDFMRTRKNPITVVGSGEVSSVAALVLQAGARRLLMPHTRLLLHYGSADMSSKGYVDGKTMNAGAAELRRLDMVFVDILCSRGADRALLAKMLEREVYITAPEAVRLKLADALITLPDRW